MYLGNRWIVSCVLLSKDAKEIKEEKNIFVKADKTTNYYKTQPNDHMTLVDKKRYEDTRRQTQRCRT